VPIYDPTTYGAVGDGKTDCTNAYLAATLDASGAGGKPPGPLYIPMTPKGHLIQNGRWSLPNANMKVFGDASMGSVLDWGPTSAVIGHGPGNTLTIPQGGCSVGGLAWRPNDMQQTGQDAFIKVLGTQVTLHDMFMDGPNIGIVQSMTWPAGGQFWVENVLIGGNIRTGGIRTSAGNSAVRLHHVRMFCNNTDAQGASLPQPAYGTLVTCAGELIVSDCDFDNCGVNLAIVPGSEGIPNQNVSAVMISNSYFDNGNGKAQFLVRPQGNGFVQNVRICGGWTSTVNNNGGTWNTDGYHFDGTLSTPPTGVNAIEDVTLVNLIAQNHLQHVGVYAIGVSGLNLIGVTAGGNYHGVQIGGQTPNTACSGLIVGCKLGNYVTPPLASPLPFSGGNRMFGVVIQKSPAMRLSIDNCLDGNGAGPIDFPP
jgi:hypothetical protein